MAVMMLKYLLPAFLGIIMAHAQNQSGIEYRSFRNQFLYD